MAKILIIDDDLDLIEAMKVVLENKGHSVISAFSGEDGLDKTKKENPDLIILDIMMETRDKGFVVAREIRKLQESKTVPILMHTSIKEKIGFDFKQEAGDEVWLPVDDYVEKPLKTEELVSKVEKLLKKDKTK